MLYQHAAVPIDDVMWLNTFMTSSGGEPILFDNAILMLRRKLFPFGHDRHPWIEGMIAL